MVDRAHHPTGSFRLFWEDRFQPTAKREKVGRSLSYKIKSDFCLGESLAEQIGRLGSKSGPQPSKGER